MLMPTDTSFKTTTKNMTQTRVDKETQELETIRHARKLITVPFLFKLSVPLPVWHCRSV